MGMSPKICKICHAYLAESRFFYIPKLLVNEHDGSGRQRHLIGEVGIGLPVSRVRVNHPLFDLHALDQPHVMVLLLSVGPENRPQRATAPGKLHFLVGLFYTDHGTLGAQGFGLPFEVDFMRLDQLGFLPTAYCSSHSSRTVPSIDKTPTFSRAARIADSSACSIENRLLQKCTMDRSSAKTHGT